MEKGINQAPDSIFQRFIKSPGGFNFNRVYYNILSHFISLF